MTVQTEPTPGRNRCPSPGFDPDNIGTNSAHPQRRSDPGLDVDSVHRAVEQQDVFQFTGPVGVAVDPAGGSPERLMGAGERPGLPGPRRGPRQCARFGLEDLQTGSN
jgi:hypothetical protein